MDKGLDIVARRALLALHAACYGPRARHLLPAVRDFLEPPHGESSLPATLVAALRRRGAPNDAAGAKRAEVWSRGRDCHLICLGDSDYPEPLQSIAVPPPVLFVRGQPALLRQPQIAMVGSRKATPQGREFANRAAADLAAAGFVVTSGLAYGIDAAAHRGALRAGAPTIAVLGCGIDVTYPARHRDLAEEIAATGALVSEFPLGTRPLRHHFPMRNRIISGLSLGTVVVEAALRSGSISTAMHALEQGREVFAVPGAVNNPVAQGCHALIRQGAKLATGAADIVEEFPAFPGSSALQASTPRASTETDAPALDPRYSRLLETCGWEPFTIDEIVAGSGLTPQNVSSMLLALELDGRVLAQAPGTYVRVR